VGDGGNQPLADNKQSSCEGGSKKLRSSLCQGSTDRSGGMEDAATGGACTEEITKGGCSPVMGRLQSPGFYTAYTAHLKSEKKKLISETKGNPASH